MAGASSSVPARPTQQMCLNLNARAMPVTPLLKVSGLSVKYGEITAVKGIDFTIASGAIAVLLGTNGAGKSSTLNALVGLIASSGSVEFQSESIDGQSAEAIVRRGIALTPEGRRVFPSLTVAENLQLGGAVHANREEQRRRIESQLVRFPILKERYRQRAGLLSGGEQQMLAIARSLMSAPKLLLLDEPSLGLAPKVVDQVFELIVALRESGITILLVEQNAHRALSIADHCYVLQNGKLVLSGPAAELAQSDAIKSAYLNG